MQHDDMAYKLKQHREDMTKTEIMKNHNMDNETQRQTGGRTQRRMKYSNRNGEEGRGNETGRRPADRRMILVVAFHWCMTKPSQDVCPWDAAIMKTRKGCNVVTGMMNLAMHNCAHHVPMMADIKC